MVLPLRYSRAWLVIGWALVVLAVLASLAPAQHLPPVGVDDKIEHTLAYALLALWFAGIYPRSRYVVIALGLFLMGVAVEWAQGAMNFGRQSDYRDMIANSLGIALGLTLALTWLGAWAQRLESWLRKS